MKQGSNNPMVEETESSSPVEVGAPPNEPKPPGGVKPRGEVPAPIPPEPIEVEELQQLEAAALHDRFAKAGLRAHPGRTRHQLVLDLMRNAVLNGQQVRTSGFLEQPNDGAAMLRSP